MLTCLIYVMFRVGKMCIEGLGFVLGYNSKESMIFWAEMNSVFVIHPLCGL